MPQALYGSWESVRTFYWIAWSSDPFCQDGQYTRVRVWMESIWSKESTDFDQHFALITLSELCDELWAVNRPHLVVF